MSYRTNCRHDGARSFPSTISAVGDRCPQTRSDPYHAEQPLRWLTTREWDHFYKAALVAKQQLDAVLQCTYSGWWCLDAKERLLDELAREADPRKRRAIIDRIQVLFYEDVGRIKLGDLFWLSVVRKELRGYFRSSACFCFWGAWLEKK
jgi:hypothetical protein